MSLSSLSHRLGRNGNLAAVALLTVVINAAALAVSLNDSSAQTPASPPANTIGSPEEGAAPPPPPPQDVRQDLGSGVMANWTRQCVEVSASATGRGVDSTYLVVEQAARGDAEQRILAAIEPLGITAQLRISDLLGDSSLNLRSRAERWAMPEVRYLSSGRVEIEGELCLQALMKPWSLSVARAMPAAGQQPSYTGVVVDARSIGLGCAFAPQIIGESGKVLYDGTLWTDAATNQVPVVYVPGPEHPAFARVGSNPLWVKASDSEGPDAILDANDTIAFTTAMREARVLGQGKMVFMVSGCR